MSHNSNDWCGGADGDWFARQISALADRRKIFRASRAESQPDLRFHLTGSQRKTAYALEKNVARMIAEHGLDRVGFLTLTVGDTVEGRPFGQVWDALEASRRINSLLTGLLRDVCGRMVIVTERHQSGAIHFHLLIEVASDIRTGFDFSAVAGGDYRSASTYLRGMWDMLRARLPGYGFGRAELMPIRSCGEAVARYVSKYVEKNLYARGREDRGKRLVRYSGWHGEQMTANQFCWATPAAVEWRRNAAAMAAMVGVTCRAEVAEPFGPRWAWRLSRAMATSLQYVDGDLPRWEARLRIAEVIHTEMIYPQWKWWRQRDEMDDESMYEIPTEEPSIETQIALFPDRYREAA